MPAETPAVPAPAVGTPATPAPELPVQPNPVTTTSAAVHIMKVPSSHLLEAFVALQRALGQAQADATPTDTRTALADMARRLATALAPSGASSVPPGAVVDTSA